MLLGPAVKDYLWEPKTFQTPKFFFCFGSLLLECVYGYIFLLPIIRLAPLRTNTIQYNLFSCISMCVYIYIICTKSNWYFTHFSCYLFSPLFNLNPYILKYFLVFILIYIALPQYPQGDWFQDTPKDIKIC